MISQVALMVGKIALVRSLTRVTHNAVDFQNHWHERSVLQLIRSARFMAPRSAGRKDRRCCATSAVNKSRNRSVDCPLDMRHDSPDAETARRSEPPD
jgi:hypothetical protein